MFTTFAHLELAGTLCRPALAQSPEGDPEGAMSLRSDTWTLPTIGVPCHHSLRVLALMTPGLAARRAGRQTPRAPGLLSAYTHLRKAARRAAPDGSRHQCPRLRT